MGRIKLFNRGIPTEPDVTALLNQFGVPEEGKPISYAAVADVLHVSVDASRFTTVTAAWRRSLRASHQVLLSARNGEFAVRDPGARVALGKSKTRSGVRCFTEAIDTVTNTDAARLTERERADADKVLRIASMSQSAALAEARKRVPPSLRAVTSADRRASSE